MIHQIHCGLATPENSESPHFEQSAGPFSPATGLSGDDHFFEILIHLYPIAVDICR